MDIQELNHICKGSFIEELGLIFTGFEQKKIEGYIDLSSSHLQPMGVVHGGVYISMAESLAGAGSSILVQNTGKISLGATVTSQHIASAKKGRIFGTGTLVYEGITKHIWDVSISDENGKLISLSRVSNSIKDESIKRGDDT
ncbi:PaaI family thioesterase [Bacteroidota bacterium]